MTTTRSATWAGLTRAASTTAFHLHKHLALGTPDWDQTNDLFSVNEALLSLSYWGITLSLDEIELNQ